MRHPRRLTVWLALLLCLAVALPAAATPLDPNGTFLDDDTSVHEADIEAIADAGVTFGCNPPDNDLYCPESPVTRAQMASFIVRGIELDTPLPTPSEDAFLDDFESVHALDIDKLAELGVTRGCNPPDNDLFCPDASVTRGQMAAFLTRAFGFSDDDPATDRFTDDNNSEFEGEIEALAAAGVTVGCNPPANDRFCPDLLVTRAQMASFLTRALDLMPLPPPSVSEAALVRPVFLLDQPAGGPYIASIARYVPVGTDTPTGAVEELLDGLSAAETAQTPAFSNEIPAGTELLGLDIAGGVATVDLSDEFDDQGTSAYPEPRLAQLTFTLLQFDDIDEVALEIEGDPQTLFAIGCDTPSGGCSGVDISDGLDLEFFNDSGLLAEKTPLAPAWFEFVESPFTVTGYSRAFEATVQWELYDNDGALIADGFATTGSGDATFREMSFEVAYTVATAQVGELMVFEYSAMDGSVIDLRETALWLLP